MAIAMSNKVRTLPRAEQWANRIGAQIGKSVESIIEIGRLLVKAQADLQHGEWIRMFDDELVPFTVGTAERLMKIAQHPQLSNSAHGPNLPPSWRTLYELTKVEPKRLSAAFKDGIVRPDMQRSDVKALLPKPASSRTVEDSDNIIEIGGRTAGTRLYARIAHLLSDEFDALSVEDQVCVLDMLEQQIQELRRLSARSEG